jgi:SAM-dependent methyltransferase
MPVNLIKKIIKRIARPPRNRESFLMNMIKYMKMGGGGALLDVGCGNNSPFIIKSILPDIFYTGIDIQSYNQTKPNLADRYIMVNPELFAETIASMENCFDIVISSHNLEHCDKRWETLDAMIKSLKSGGFLYIAFPCGNSITFPSRALCLNYFDDTTHKENPPEYNFVIERLKRNNMDILFSSKSYKPIIMYLIGFFFESLSKKQKRTSYGTWQYWGFETIIWAKKK